MPVRLIRCRPRAHLVGFVHLARLPSAPFPLPLLRPGSLTRGRDACTLHYLSVTFARRSLFFYSPGSNDKVTMKACIRAMRHSQLPTLISLWHCDAEFVNTLPLRLLGSDLSRF